MNKIKVLIITFLFANPLLSYSQPDEITTCTINASIGMQQSYPAEVAACLDSNYNTHIAWVQTIDNRARLMYSIYNNEKVTTQTIDSSKLAFITAPAIAIGNNQVVHIVYMVKRKPGNILHSGNYAIRYATNNNRKSLFQVEQVSSNVFDAKSNPSQPLDCYVNDRPQIKICANEPTIFYLSNAYKENYWKNRLIAAKKSNEKWNYQLLSQMSGLSVNSGYEILTSANKKCFQPVFIQLKHNQPSVFTSNEQVNNLRIKKQGANNSNIRTVDNVNNADRIIWLANTSQYAGFCHFTNNKTKFNEIDTIFLKQVPQNLQTDATIDTNTGVFFGIYQTPMDNSVLVVSDFENYTQELEIGRIGKIHGKQCLNLYKGFVSIVTACTETDKLFVTTCQTNFAQKCRITGTIDTGFENITTGGSEQIADNKDNIRTAITIYPNPASDGIYYANSKASEVQLEQIRMYSISGRLLYTFRINNNTWQHSHRHIPLDNYENGIYFMHFIFNDRREMKKLIIEH